MPWASLRQKASTNLLILRKIFCLFLLNAVIVQEKCFPTFFKEKDDAR